MKKILFISTALLASLTACEDYNDQFNLGSQISDVKKGVAIKLAAADYATVANNATNKEIALSKDPEKGTYVAALEAIGKQIFCRQNGSRMVPASFYYRKISAG